MVAVSYKKPKLDEFGNPVVNFKSMSRTRDTPLWMRKKKGGKRGRPRTRPERTTPKRPYKRSFLHTKEAKAAAKALREAKRAEKAATKAILGKTMSRTRDTPLWMRKKGGEKARSADEMAAANGLLQLGNAGAIPGAIPAGGRGKGRPKLPLVSGPFS